MEVPPPVAQSAGQKGSGWKKIALGCGGLVALVVLAVAAWFIYDMMQSASLLAAAKEKQAQGDYEGAVSDLQTLMTEYSSFNEADEAAVLLPQVRFEWADALREQGEFEEALQRFDQVGDPARAEEIAEGKLQTRLEWGEALVEEQQFAEAQQQFDQVMTEAQTGPLYDQARAALPDVYIGLSEESFEQGDVATAFAHLSNVFENYQSGEGRQQAIESFQQLVEPLYTTAQQQRGVGEFAQAESAMVAIINYAPEHSLTAQIQSELPALYFEWGQALAAAERYEEASGVYQHLLDTYPESEFTPQATTALIDARVAAIGQSGQAGQLPPPQAAAASGDSSVTYEVANDTVCTIEVLMSGPTSQALTLQAQTSNQVQLEAGTYNLVVQIDETASTGSDCQDVIPFTGESVFESGTVYQSSFYIETTPQ